MSVQTKEPKKEPRQPKLPEGRYKEKRRGHRMNSRVPVRIEWDGAPNHYVAVLDYRALDATPGKTVGEISSSLQLEGSAGHYTRTNHAEVKQGQQLLAVKWDNNGRDPLSPPGFGARVIVTSK